MCRVLDGGASATGATAKRRTATDDRRGGAATLRRERLGGLRLSRIARVLCEVMVLKRRVNWWLLLRSNPRLPFWACLTEGVRGWVSGRTASMAFSCATKSGFVAAVPAPTEQACLEPCMYSIQHYRALSRHRWLAPRVSWCPEPSVEMQVFVAPRVTCEATVLGGS